MEQLPPEIIIGIAFVFGVVIGSFLNVVIYRLHTGKSLNDRSHCLSCAKPLTWYELFPLLSYLCLRGRCLGCKSRIPSRYFLVELLTGLCFVLVVTYTQNLYAMLLLMILLSVLVVGTVYDLYHMIIPDEVVAISAVTALAFVLFSMPVFSVATVSVAILAGALAFAVYGGLWRYSSGRWIGFGDAKLAFPLGMLVGIGGVFTLVVLSFWVGAAISVCIIGYQRVSRWFVRSRQRRRVGISKDSGRCPTGRVDKSPRYFTIKSEIPFAPFLVIAFLLTFFYGADVLSLTTYVIDSIYQV